MLSIKNRKVALKHLGFKDMKSFQKYAGINADGRYGSITDRHLQRCVKHMKKQLKKQKGVTAKITENGIIGSGTIKAVKQYQKKNKYKVTGVLNANQRDKLAIYKFVPSKRKFGFQNWLGSINWNKVEKNGFSKAEFMCHCGCGKGADRMNIYTLNAVMKVREKFAKKENGKYNPVTISSPYRCEKNNKRVGGVSGSQHTKGNAVDFYGVFTNTKTKRDKIKKYIKKLPHYNYTYSDANAMGTAIHMDFKR